MALSPSYMYVYSREISLKVKVVGEDGQVAFKLKISVDRDTITLERLTTHLRNRLNLKGKFILKYPMRTREGNTMVPLTDDWDLDVALQQFRHSLTLFLEMPDSDAGCLTPDDTLTSTSQTLLTSHTSKPPSVLDRLMDKVDRWLIGSSEETSKSKAPMTFREFQNYLDSEGRVVNYQGFRESIYLGGVAPSMRKIAWRHLLCIFPEDMTADERIQFLQVKSEQYGHMRDEWKNIYNEGSDVPEQMRFVTSMVKKDVVRTDRNTTYYKGKDDNKHTMSLFNLLCTYALYHPSVSYCQGMCDLASPLLAVQDNEAHAYLLFCSLMERMKSNFSYDSTAISTKFSHLTQLLRHFDSDLYAYLKKHQLDNLLFAYRWLLLEMKREFSFEDSCYFTEVMWSSLPTLPTAAGVSLRPLNSPSCFDSSTCKRLSPCHSDFDTASTCTTTSSVTTELVECTELLEEHSVSEKDDLVEGSNPLEEHSMSVKNDLVECSDLLEEHSKSKKDDLVECSDLLEEHSESEKDDLVECSDLLEEHSMSEKDDLVECSDLLEEHCESEKDDLVECSDLLEEHCVSEKDDLVECNDLLEEHSVSEKSVKEEEAESDDAVFSEDTASECDSNYAHDEGTLQNNFCDGDLKKDDNAKAGNMVQAVDKEFSSITCDLRQGSSSVDSGFGSRSGSPTRDDSAGQLTVGHMLTDEAAQLFPPPKQLGYGNPFLMFASLALLIKQRDSIIGKNMDFNDIVMLFTGYKSHWNVHAVVKEAKQLYEAYIIGGLEPDDDEFD